MKIQNEKIFKLVSAIGDLQEDMVYQSVCELAEQNMTPYYIQKCINIGMELIDGYYQSGEYFLADLLYAGYIYI